MRHRLYLAVLLIAGLCLPMPRAAAQGGARAFSIFLDCTDSRCDPNFYRTELEFVNHVRERTAADVHVLVADESTGGGGRRYTIAFYGQRVFDGLSDTLVITTPQGATEPEQRRTLVRTTAQICFVAAVAHWALPAAAQTAAPASTAPVIGTLTVTATATATEVAPLAPLPHLDVPGYMGTWYQVAWFPNRFQKQCVSNTTATYLRVPEGVEVLNRCRLADGRIDNVVGLARPAGSVLLGDRLEPAKLEVSFLPAWLRWLPIWGAYWVIQRADDGRYAVISEASRKYLWVLSRTPQLSAADETAIRSRLVQQGFDLSPWQAHPHPPAADASR